jgi:DNA-binding CsgD family transcriptional regulator
LAGAGVDLSKVASHVLLGADPGDLEAVGWLRAAAAGVGASAPSAAVDLLRGAIVLLPAGHPEIDLINAEMAEAMYRAGRVAEATELAESVLARPHRDEADIPLRLTLVSALSLQNRPITLINRAESALQVSGLSPADRALVLAQESYGRIFSGDFIGGESTARRALSLAQQVSSVEMTVWSLSALTVAVKTQGRYGEALESSRRAVALAFDPLDDAARLRHPHFFLGMALADSDRLTEAAEAYARVLENAEQLGSAWLVPDMLALSGELRFLIGAWEDAAAELESGLHLAGEHGQRISTNQSRAYLAVMATARGDVPGAKAALETVAGQLTDEAPYYAAEVVAFAAAAVAEAEGDQLGALETLQRFWQRDLELGIRYYHRYLGPVLVRLALAAGKPDVASEVVATLEASAALAPEVPTVQAAALRCRGLLERDPEPLMAAVDLARQGGRALDHAAACEDAAACLGGHRADEAKELLHEAQSRYDDMGAQAWSARVAAGLRGLGVRQGARGPRRNARTGFESLTRSEAAVSELVGRGITNREVARRLHVSPHTVNTHLRHVFQKLGVTTRAELAAMMARSRADGITHSSDVSAGGRRGS